MGAREYRRGQDRGVVRARRAHRPRALFQPQPDPVGRRPALSPYRHLCVSPRGARTVRGAAAIALGAAREARAIARARSRHAHRRGAGRYRADRRRYAGRSRSAPARYSTRANHEQEIRSRQYHRFSGRARRLFRSRLPPGVSAHDHAACAAFEDAIAAVRRTGPASSCCRSRTRSRAASPTSIISCRAPISISSASIFSASSIISWRRAARRCGGSRPYTAMSTRFGQCRDSAAQAGRRTNRRRRHRGLRRRVAGARRQEQLPRSRPNSRARSTAWHRSGRTSRTRSTTPRASSSWRASRNGQSEGTA